MVPQDEAALYALSPAKLRCHEAERFLELFVKSCGPPRDSYFEMICYSDAFLFALISVEEMVDAKTKSKLHGKPMFRFLKALRNITTHHSNLSLASSGSKFPRPFVRHIKDSVESSARLCFKFEVLRKIFDLIEKERPKDKNALNHARIFVNSLEGLGKPVFLENVFADGLDCISVAIA